MNRLQDVVRVRAKGSKKLQFTATKKLSSRVANERELTCERKNAMDSKIR